MPARSVAELPAAPRSRVASKRQEEVVDPVLAAREAAVNLEQRQALHRLAKQRAVIDECRLAYAAKSQELFRAEQRLTHALKEKRRLRGQCAEDLERYLDEQTRAALGDAEVEYRLQLAAGEAAVKQLRVDDEQQRIQAAETEWNRGVQELEAWRQSLLERRHRTERKTGEARRSCLRLVASVEHAHKAVRQQLCRPLSKAAFAFDYAPRTLGSSLGHLESRVSRARDACERLVADEMDALAHLELAAAEKWRENWQRRDEAQDRASQLGDSRRRQQHDAAPNAKKNRGGGPTTFSSLQDGALSRALRAAVLDVSAARGREEGLRANEALLRDHVARQAAALLLVCQELHAQGLHGAFSQDRRLPAQPSLRGLRPSAVPVVRAVAATTNSATARQQPQPDPCRYSRAALLADREYARGLGAESELLETSVAEALGRLEEALRLGEEERDGREGGGDDDDGAERDGSAAFPLPALSDVPGPFVGAPSRLPSGPRLHKLLAAALGPAGISPHPLFGGKQLPCAQQSAEIDRPASAFGQGEGEGYGIAEESAEGSMGGMAGEDLGEVREKKVEEEEEMEEAKEEDEEEEEEEMEEMGEVREELLGIKKGMPLKEEEMKGEGKERVEQPEEAEEGRMVEKEVERRKEEDAHDREEPDEMHEESRDREEGGEGEGKKVGKGEGDAAEGADRGRPILLALGVPADHDLGTPVVAVGEEGMGTEAKGAEVEPAPPAASAVASTERGDEEGVAAEEVRSAAEALGASADEEADKPRPLFYALSSRSRRASAPTAPSAPAESSSGRVLQRLSSFVGLRGSSAKASPPSQPSPLSPQPSPPPPSLSSATSFRLRLSDMMGMSPSPPSPTLASTPPRALAADEGGENEAEMEKEEEEEEAGNAVLKEVEEVEEVEQEDRGVVEDDDNEEEEDVSVKQEMGEEQTNDADEEGQMKTLEEEQKEVEKGEPPQIASTPSTKMAAKTNSPPAFPFPAPPGSSPKKSPNAFLAAALADPPTPSGPSDRAPWRRRGVDWAVVKLASTSCPRGLLLSELRVLLDGAQGTEGRGTEGPSAARRPLVPGLIAL